MAIGRGVMMAAVVAGMAAPAVVLAADAPAPSAAMRPDQVAFRALYKELVETDTSLSAGSCTLAAARMAAHLRAAGLPERDIVPFSVPDHPKEGGVVAIVPGNDAKARPILLLAHLDVVEAHRADWVRDPFTLIEDGPYLYARGSVDDKAMAAVWTDTLDRLVAGHVPLRRTVKMALTCGEETSGAFNGAGWLAKNRRDLIDAAYALNEGGGGRTDGTPVSAGGHLTVETVQVGEKTYQDFTVTATNPGGHSSMPVRANAIYDMADALVKLRDLEFPVEMNATNRAFFATVGRARGDAVGQAMVTLATAAPGSAAAQAAEAVVNQDRMLHSMLRTTCVATMIDGGHAHNALPQRVTVNVNCRMFPGRTPEETRDAIANAIGNPAVTVAIRAEGAPVATPPPLDPAVIGPMQALAARHFPGVTFAPVLLTGATDGRYLEAVGIPTYGVPGMWLDPDGNGLHGLNERIETRSLLDGRDYLYDLVQALAAR